MNKIEAPDFGGTWEWEGELNPRTLITLANGEKVLYSKLITLTNGEVLEWFDENMDKVVREGK